MIKVDAQIRFDSREMKKIESDIRRGVLYNIQSRLLRAVPFLEKILPTEVRERITNCDVMQALVNGDRLRYDLGLTTEEVNIMRVKIPDVISKNIVVRVTTDGKDSVHLIVEMTRNILEDLLAIPEASFIQTFTRNTPREIRWLEWLLTKGDAIVVHDWCAWLTPNNPNSRSGGAVMGHKGSFRILPQWSGVVDNNFISRALEDIDEFVYSIINKFLLEGYA